MKWYIFVIAIGRLLVAIIIGTIGSCSLVAGDAPVISTQYSSYIPPISPDTSYSVSPSTHYNAPSSQYGTPAKGGYAPAVKPTYGPPPVPLPSYGPPPSTYGVPAHGGYDSIRDFNHNEESSFYQKRLFNTSVALTVPLFSFTLPQRSATGIGAGSSVDLANQVSLNRRKRNVRNYRYKLLGNYYMKWKKNSKICYTWDF